MTACSSLPITYELAGEIANENSEDIVFSEKKNEKNNSTVVFACLRLKVIIIENKIFLKNLLTINIIR